MKNGLYSEYPFRSFAPQMLQEGTLPKMAKLNLNNKGGAHFPNTYPDNRQ